MDGQAARGDSIFHDRCVDRLHFMTDALTGYKMAKTNLPALASPGSGALKNSKRERYSRLRALAQPRIAAYREAGYETTMVVLRIPMPVVSSVPLGLGIALPI